jgi:uncharacterized membrane protein HdeD (DUF308 family)
LTSGDRRKWNYARLGEESDLTLEVVILLILGVFALLFGLLLFRIHSGGLPYTPESTYGLFLVIISFQVITMGKTPFGDLHRSWALIIIAICTAILGMAACFIPGYLAEHVRILVGGILVAGGIALLLQLKDKAKKWMNITGLFQQLTIACSVVYLLSVILGLVTLLPDVITDEQTAVLLVIYGISFFFLGWCIQRIARLYSIKGEENQQAGRMTVDSANPSTASWLFREACLSLSQAILLVLGTLLSFLGILLVPVNLGLLPFSPDGQLGLLLVIIAIQMLVLGNTPMGKFRRSWELSIIGFLFATLGIFSCIVPGILTHIISLLVGVSNITGGSMLLAKQYFPMLCTSNSVAKLAEISLIPKRQFVLQTVLNVVGIIFGITMLVPGLVSGLVIAGILLFYGLLWFGLTYVLSV